MMDPRLNLALATIVTKTIARTMITAATIALLVACGDPKYTAPPIVVTLASTPGTPLNTGASEGVTAVVSNDTGSNKVNWSCLASGECGVFSPAQIASNVPTCYTAPGSVPPGGTVTITATSVTDPTKSVSAMITIMNGASEGCP